MERITLEYPGYGKAGKKALAGVVGSGDMEALFEPDTAGKLAISITTSAGRLVIHDFGATPGVARLRIEQVFEEAHHE